MLCGLDRDAVPLKILFVVLWIFLVSRDCLSNRRLLMELWGICYQCFTLCDCKLVSFCPNNNLKVQNTVRPKKLWVEYNFSDKKKKNYFTHSFVINQKYDIRVLVTHILNFCHFPLKKKKKKAINSNSCFAIHLGSSLPWRSGNKRERRREEGKRKITSQTMREEKGEIRHQWENWIWFFSLSHFPTWEMKKWKTRERKESLCRRMNTWMIMSHFTQ